PWVIPTGASDGTGAWAYLAASEELRQDYQYHGIVPDYIVSATGSGGTLAGLSLGHHLYCPEVKVLGMAVCDDAEYFRTKVRDDIAALCKNYHQVPPPDLPHPEVIDKYIGAGYAQAGEEVFATI